MRCSTNSRMGKATFSSADPISLKPIALSKALRVSSFGFPSADKVLYKLSRTKFALAAMSPKLLPRPSLKVEATSASKQNYTHSKLQLAGWYTLVSLYLVIRFGFTQQLDALGTYSSYVFEVFCVSVALALFGKEIFTALTIRKQVSYGMVLGAAGGFGVYKFAASMGILIPFDLSGRETILFLLVVAPILEEAIFRFLVWQPIELLSRRRAITLVTTSAIFAYSHLHAIWFVPPEIHNFILYQTAYTFLLGLACGYYVYHHSSLACAMLIHFCFNLGFFLAS